MKVICERYITTGCSETACQHREPHKIRPEVHTDVMTIPLNYNFTDPDAMEMRALCTDYMECYGGYMTRCIYMVETYYKKYEEERV
jgi:hypothetical protein